MFGKMYTELLTVVSFKDWCGRQLFTSITYSVLVVKVFFLNSEQEILL